MVIHLFRNLDLFRWNKNTLFVGPRLILEAEVLCRHRFGGADAEATGLLELIESVRDGGIDSRRDERRFLLELLRQLGPDGIRGDRYQSAYVKIALALTKLRKKYGTVDAGLMIQESTFRRYAIRYQKVDQSDCLPLLEEARDVIQLALDGVDDGSIYAARKTKDNLLVERATIYGFLARNRADSHASAEDTWSAYEAARTAVRKAVSVTSAYYPLDIGLWTPSDLLKSGALKELQQADLRADIYSTLDQVEPDLLPPQQREKFHARQMIVGTVLGDYHLTDRAFSELRDRGSTAGYFLRARGLISDLSRDAVVFDTSDVAAARRAAEFLSSHFDRIKDDQRCLRLLLECRWIVETGRWPFRGLRQPVPFDPVECRGLLAIVRALNAASGPSSQPLHRYLEAMLTWLIGDEQSAIRMFRVLAQDTGHEFGGRVTSRHTITGTDGVRCRFQGRVERDRGAGHWTVRVRVGGVDRQVDLLSRNFNGLCREAGKIVRHCQSALELIVRENDMDTIDDLKRRVDRSWSTDRWDALVGDICVRLSLRINVPKFRNSRLSGWRTFLDTVPEEDDPEQAVNLIIERDLLNHASDILPIDGRDVMSALDLGPGPVIGSALQYARELFRSGIRDRA